MRYEEFYRQSVEEPERFWAEQARLIHWETPPRQILDQSNPPFRRWFVGGTTNLCYNAVDRHLAERAEQLALVAISSETDATREFTYRQLHREVNTFAAVLQSLDVGKGDRVVIYLPNMAEAVFAMLACARIGAIHSVVFGGFAAHNLALRIDDAQPKLLIAADAGMRAGKVIPYKPLVDAALNEASAPPPHVLIIDRGLDRQMTRVAGRDLDYASLRAQHADAEVPVTWLESNEPSYLLYTSGTTGKPKGVQRDVGGYAVAMALSIRRVFDIAPGQVMFSTSDVGWAVGHSYNVYGPLIGGATSLLYEGLPTRPDAGIWWQLCERYKVRTMFSSPTAIRVLKKQDESWLKKYDLSTLKWLFLAGEPLDEPTARWITGALGVPVIDNYWQTETGWPAITLMPGLDLKTVKFGSPGLPAPGYRMKVIDENTGQEVAAGTREIEESVASHPAVAEAAVVGVKDELKGQVPIVFATLKRDAGDGAADVARAMQQRVVDQLGGVARPSRIYVVNALPKTRSGKLLRRSLQALAEHRDPGDLSTLDDPGALEGIRQALDHGPDQGS